MRLRAYWLQLANLTHLTTIGKKKREPGSRRLDTAWLRWLEENHRWWKLLRVSLLCPANFAGEVALGGVLQPKYRLFGCRH